MLENTNTRDIAKRAVREQIARAALRRFMENGFDKTTIDEIAQDIGMSKRTFFRYFSTKEDTLLDPTNQFKDRFLAKFATHIQSNEIWVALGLTIDQSVYEIAEIESLHADVQALIQANPSLQARQLEIIERMQLEATDIYMATAPAEASLGWATANAIVRAAFGCWYAVEISMGSTDLEKSRAHLCSIMAALCPRVLT